MHNVIKDALPKKQKADAERHQSLRILRRREVEARTGLKRSHLYQLVKNGEFPSPISLTAGRAVGWLEHEVEAFIAARVAASRAA